MCIEGDRWVCCEAWDVFQQVGEEEGEEEEEEIVVYKVTAVVVC